MAGDIEFKCGACGGQSFLCANDPPLPEDIISCKTCGHRIGTIGEITKRILQASGDTALNELAQLRADAFGK